MDQTPASRTRRLTGRARGADLGLLVSLLAVAAGAAAFLKVADEVAEGEAHHVEARVLRAFRDPADSGRPIGPPWLAEGVRDATALGSVAVLGLVTAAVAGFLLVRRAYRAMALVLVATAGGQALSLALKGFFDRPRPDVVPPLVVALNSSFPSGHSMLSAIVYPTLGALLARLVEGRTLRAYILGWSLLLTLIVGLSRVYLGVHYPSDVLAGWSAGLSWAILCVLVERRLQRRGIVEPSAGTIDEPGGP